MVVTITVPYAKGPGEDIGAIRFLESLEASFSLMDIPHYTIKGTSPRTMLDLSTSAARSTQYTIELSSSLVVSSIHIDIQSYSNDSKRFIDKESINSDIVFGILPTFTDIDFMERIAKLTEAFAYPQVREVDMEMNYASGLSEFIFDTPSIVIKVNEGSVDLFPALAEVVAEAVAREVSQRMQQDSLEEELEV